MILAVKKQSRRRRVAPLLGLAVIAAVAALFLSPASGPGGAGDAVTRYGYEVVNTYPHDPGAFTQGLVFRDGFLYESTGLRGRSTLRKVRLESGEAVAWKILGSAYFAEGLTDWGDTLIQVTWHAGTAFVYDLRTLAPTKTFRYPGLAWGLTRHGNRLVMSDGTATLRFLDPGTMVETGRIEVAESGRPVANLNELEEVRGEIFANVWQTDEIVSIDPVSGKVTGRIDLSGLLAPADRARPDDVLNGIAYDAENDRLFVTGKRWPKLFEIRLKPR